MKKLSILLLSLISIGAYANSDFEKQYDITFYDELGNGDHLVQLARADEWIECTPRSGTVSTNQTFHTQCTYHIFDDSKEQTATFMIGVGPIDGQQYINLVKLADLSENQPNICRIFPNSKSGITVSCNGL